MGHRLATESSRINLWVMSSKRILSRSFFEQDTIDVAEQLIGCYLCRRLPTGEILKARIVETEAYLGTEDPSCHSFSGRPTARTSAMFGPKGHVYVYLIYGVHFCLNIVTGAANAPEAVLIRALEHDLDLKGPGKICRILNINKQHNDMDLTDSEELWIEYAELKKGETVVTGPRIGLNTAEDAAYWPLRFGLGMNLHLSRPFAES